MPHFASSSSSLLLPADEPGPSLQALLPPVLSIEPSETRDR